MSRLASANTQHPTPNTPLCGIGLSLEHTNAREKVTGAARYAVDVLPAKTLWGVTVRSPYPHARIVRIDTTRAMQVPGVRAIITSADLPDRRFGRWVKDQPVLARGVVRFVAEKVVAIAADTLDAAEEAAALVEVEYEELPAVFDPVEAVKPGAPVLHHNPGAYEGWGPGCDLPNAQSHECYELGEPDAAFRTAEVVSEGTYTAAAMHQGHLEPHACVVDVRPDGTCTVWSSNKMPYIIRQVMAPLFGLREEDIVVVNLPVGGDFGAKGCVMDEPIAYELSRRTGRPVKLIMTSPEEFAAANPRHGAKVTVRLAATRDGHLTAARLEVYFDGGAYLSYKPVPKLPATHSVGGPYRIPNARVDAYCVYTNSMPRGYMRAPGGPQLCFPFESELDELARKLNLDPLELRRRNAIRDGERSTLGEAWIGIRFQETLERAVSAFGEDSTGVASYSVRGIGIAACSKHVGGGLSNVAVEVEASGLVRVISGLTDPGTGAMTVLRQIVAEELQVPVEQVQIQLANTDQAEFEAGSAASRLTRTAGTAAQRAARGAREVLTKAAGDLLECPEELLVWEPGEVHVQGQPERRASFGEVAAAACERYPSAPTETDGAAVVHADGSFDEIDYADYPTFAVAIVEVEVDPETGGVRLLRFVIAQDVGTIVNPRFAQGQLHGGAVQSFGIALTEELRLEGGRVVNPNLGEYKLLTMADTPPEFRIEFVEGAPGPGPFNAKGIGEICIEPGVAAIANAIANATGVRARALPIRPETIVQEWRRLQAAGMAAAPTV